MSNIKMNISTNKPRKNDEFNFSQKKPQAFKAGQTLLIKPLRNNTALIRSQRKPLMTEQAAARARGQKAINASASNENRK